MDRATTAVLARLRRGPASTIELQAELYATHVPKQVWDLRAAGYLITTTRLPNGVAQYRLLGEPTTIRAMTSEPDAPVGAGVADGRWANDDLVPSSGPVPAPSRAPVFGDPVLLREMRPKGRR
jgi:hypothetical protein